MLKKIETIVVVCDVCHEEYQDCQNYVRHFLTREEATEEMQKTDWHVHISGNPKSPLVRTYCPQHINAASQNNGGNNRKYIQVNERRNPT